MSFLVVLAAAFLFVNAHEAKKFYEKADADLPVEELKPAAAAIPGHPKFISLKDAQQSSTYPLDNCKGNKCTANKALDGDLSTVSVTLSGGSSQWWSAVLVDVSRIERILVYVSPWAFNNGNFNRFKVETKRYTDGAWTVCKEEYKMEAPSFPHIVQCSSPTIAKYIRLALVGGEMLYLREVKVWGVEGDELQVEHQHVTEDDEEEADEDEEVGEEDEE